MRGCPDHNPFVFLRRRYSLHGIDFQVPTSVKKTIRSLFAPVTQKCDRAFIDLGVALGLDVKEHNRHRRCRKHESCRTLCINPGRNNCWRRENLKKMPQIFSGASRRLFTRGEGLSIALV